MMKNGTPPLSKGNLYRMPWSMNDNPIGWVEITDICNIKCEGCYRLVLGEGHKSFETIMEEILFLKKWRNCDNITLAGGEPILHPDILGIVRFIKAQKMKCIILTNGYALTVDLLKNLKKAGLTGLSFHLDTTQIRPEFDKNKIEKESDIHFLRMKYAKMLKKENMYAHFGITVTTENAKEIPEFLQWAIDNMKMINGISLIIQRGLPVEEGIDYYALGNKVDMSDGKLGYAVPGDQLEDIGMTSKDVYGMIKKHFPDYDASSYLGGTVDHTSFKWLIGNIIVNSKGKSFGAYGKRTVELAQIINHLFTGSYFAYPKKRIGAKIFFMSLFDKKLRKAFWRFLKYSLVFPLRFFYPINSFGIAIIQAPDLLPDGRVDMCDDCPDMCIHEGQLVNSCRLDECRLFGELLQVQVSKEQGERVKKNREKVPVM